MDANIFFGSIKEVSENFTQRKSPYSGDVVSRACICSKKDALEALEIAQNAAEYAKKTTLVQRCNWILDVANKLESSKDDMAIVCEEVFAPIVSLIKVESFDDAFPRMNNSPFGLQFSVFTNRVISELEAGGVVINDIPILRFDIQPYGGVKLSGVGREGSRSRRDDRNKSVIIC